MQEQIQMSGLEIMSCSSPFQWNCINHWSPLLGGGRDGQTCVTIAHPCENDAAAQTIVVLGGGNESDWFINSVIVWDPSAMEWRLGPNLNDKRTNLVVVVCHDKVYAIGGRDENGQVLDTMESIQVSSLLETMEASTARQDNSHWTRLQCRLSSPRHSFDAVVVQNRYIVILGGDSDRELLSSVDIMDTAPPHNNNNNGEPTIVAGPRMNSSRCAFGAAVMDNRIFVVGGYVNEMPSTSVESLLFQQQPLDKDHTNSNSNAHCMFPNSSWRVERHLTLSVARFDHAVAKVGSCLVVAGGRTGVETNLVEMLDVQRGTLWSLPNLNIERPIGCSMVALSDCLLVLGGNALDDSVESLALTVSRKHERCYKFLKFLIEIEFLGPTHMRNYQNDVSSFSESCINRYV